MSQFRFAQLSWVHAIWVVVGVTVALVLLEMRGWSILDRMLSRMMQARLVTRTSFPRRLAAILMLAMSLLLLVLALMRPQWGVTIQSLTRVDSQIMVCLDVSKSMLAEDVAPNRLDRAKAELESLLGILRDGQQVGLIAFAGKAAVLCPMTTDFGFLRLVLNDVGPGSVGLGGTKIGQALRKAVDGFGQAGDVNRLILLITDGEDHDSFPVDVAKLARERGIRIVSVGFGDEAGSKIEITDPRTGARSFVKDRDGKDVISRLDGETLREIALETEGAYVPAGTGALDLESIYEQHIASMLTGETKDAQRVHRNEAYQWCVLGGLIFLILSLLTASPWSLKMQAISRSQDLMAGRSGQAAVLALFLLACCVRSAVAQQSPGTPTTPTPESPPSEASEESRATAGTKTEDQVSPRVLYNRALDFLGSDPNRAERILNRARRESGVDGEVRFRALYNLGWVEVNRAEAVLQDNPKEAIGHLQQAANRFREAIRVRPESTDARHNLEIISRRILELTDALARTDQRDLAVRLDELIEQQRAAQAELAALVQKDASDEGAHQNEDRRREYRRLGVSLRQIISDGEKLASDARRELDALAQKKEEELATEERIRIAQLTGMQRFLDGSLQRMQKGRGLARRTQGNRAFSRWSLGITDAKRARDQLRNPIEVLGVIIQDATQLANLTRSLAQAKSTLMPDEGNDEGPPAWLTQEYVSDLQRATTERTSELTAMLKATLQGSANEKGDSSEEPADDEQRRAEELMKGVAEAVPLLEQADGEFQQALSQLEAENYAGGFEHQSTGILALLDAAELFFDVRRMIERIYGEQQGLRAVLASDAELHGATELIESLSAALEKNQQRCDRLDEMFASELARLSEVQSDAPAPGSASADPADTTPDPQQQRYEIAQQILKAAVEDMAQLSTALAVLSSAEPAVLVEPESGTNEENQDSPADVPEAVADSRSNDPAAVTRSPLIQTALDHAEASINKIEELRRLFFSLVEHLRDTGQRQANLSDDTQQIAGQPERQTSDQVGPLTSRQQQLQQIADQIGQALKQQAQDASKPQPQADDSSSAEQAAMQQRYQEAGDLVQEAQAAMGLAAESLSALSSTDEIPKDFSSAGEQQKISLEKIAEALALLDDSPPQDNNQGQQDQQQQDQQQDQQQQNENQDQQQQQQSLDANQLLQLIKDREAQRRKDRQRMMPAGAGAVDKDW